MRTALPPRYYVDADGVYLGAFAGIDIDGTVTTPDLPGGAIEVPEAPADARQVWDGEAWGPVPAPPPVYGKTRLFEAMSEAEAETWLAAEATFPARARLIYYGDGNIESDHPLFAALHAAMVAAYGEDRTAELLTAARL